MSKIKIIDRKEILKYFDENQRNLYKNFPEGHLLSRQENAENFIMLITYWRRNLHRFAMEYLGLKLHLYQQIILFFMGISSIVAIVAARASAKSYIIGIYETCVSILYPNSRCGITSSTLPQAEIIINQKIMKELAGSSPTLPNEIKKHKEVDGKSKILFKNNSEIVSVTLSPNSRGNRTTSNVCEEARELDKKKIDEYVSPFKYSRPAAYMTLPYYANMTELLEEPSEIYISSSIEDVHWLYKLAKDTFGDFLRGKPNIMLAFDYSISLKHNIRTFQTLINERRKTDPVTWAIEYENAVLRSNTKAFFTYDMIKECQTGLRAFYPRKAEDVINKKANLYSIPKQKGEIRIIACDIATVDRDGNDNSCYSCLRLLPESIQTFAGKERVEYIVKIPYLEAPRGGDTQKQAIRIRQLFADFDADYIVLDVRNAGIAVMFALERTLYDDERCVEYPPIKCMNDETLNKSCSSSAALPIVYAISASAQLNSAIAINFQSMLNENRVELLVPKDRGVEEVKKFSSEYRGTDDPDIRLWYEYPYLQTMLLFSELINLEYSKNALGVIRIYERPSMTKDRYSSVSYGCYFATELARDLTKEEEDIPLEFVHSCVTTLDW